MDAVSKDAPRPEPRAMELRAWALLALAAGLLIASSWSIARHGVAANLWGLAIAALCLLVQVFALPACAAVLRQVKPSTEAVGPGYAIWTLTCALVPVMGLIAPVMLLGKLEVFVVDEDLDATARARLPRARAPLLAANLLLASIAVLTALGVILL